MTRRLTLIRLGAAAATCAVGRAAALMHGEAPDSAVRRLDPNTRDSPWSGVASLSIAGSVYSSVLLSPLHVLTASHVVPEPPGFILVNFNIGSDLSHRIRVARHVRHPRFRGLGLDGGAYDLCLLELEQPAPAAARVHPVFAGPAAPGMLVRLVGYGASGPGSRGVTVGANPALKRVGSNVVEQLLPAGDQSTPPLLYVFRFDAPAAGTRAEPDETGLAGGDSGSPAFVRSGPLWQLFGINTHVLREPHLAAPPFGYGTRAAGQVVNAHLGWLRSIVGSTLRVS